MMLKMYAKKAGFGVGLGLLFSIPLTLAGQAIGRSELVEAGQRIGSVASAAAGGTVGNAAYQIADAVFDRFVAVNGQQVSGGRGGFGI